MQLNHHLQTFMSNNKHLTKFCNSQKGIQYSIHLH